MKTLLVSYVGGLMLVAFYSGACRMKSRPATTTPGERIQERQSTYATLVAEALRVEDSLAIKRLQYAYGYYLEKGLWNQVVDLFTDDATIEFGNEGVYFGRKRIYEYYSRLFRNRVGLPYGRLNTHLFVMPLITVSEDGTTAHGRWKDIVMEGELGNNAFWSDGVYENQYRKEGRIWKISHLHRYTTFIAPYNGGWVKSEAKPDISIAAQGFPPDAPPTFDYEPFPGVFIPPYHADKYVPQDNPLVHGVMLQGRPNGKVSPKSAGQDLHQIQSGTGVATARVFLAEQDRNRNLKTALPEQTASELQSRILRALDVEEIENLISAYGYYLESFIWDPLADLFAEDGSIEIAHRGVYVGKKRVRDSLELYGANGLHARELHPHIPLQAVIHVAPDGLSAKIRRRAWLEMGIHGGSGTWGEGVYEDEAVKRNGIWRFKKVHFMNTFFAPYEGGWEVTTERRNPGVSQTNPPDLPPTLQYGIFPEVYIPRFHYENPGKASHVSGNARPDALNQASALNNAEDPIAGLAKRVQRIEDELELRNLQQIFGYYFDKCLWDEVTALFIDGGTFEVADLGVYVGKPSVRRFLDAFGAQPISRGVLNNHMQLQPIITVADDGTTAKARWHLWAQLGKVSQSSQWGEGIYENEYIKENGAWKIRKIHFFPNMYTDYQRGWGQQAYKITGLLAAAPKPDRPPSVEAASYPKPYVPPFHYLNPVTGR